jgi:membrane peptidoglycan carboxypeptidase
MHDHGNLSDDEYEKARTERVVFADIHDTIRAPYFSLWLKKELVAQFGEDAVYTGGMKVYTTLDPRLQDLAERTVKDFAAKNKKSNRAANAALVAMDPKTGGVLAMVGGKDYFGQAEPAGCTPGKNCVFEPNTNVATSLRQVGSSFKPYVYVTAFSPEFKYTPATIISDRSKNFSAAGAPAYIPHNYTGAQYGNVPIRKALAGSLNIAAVNTLSQIGIDPVVQTLRSVGVTAPLKNCGLALALGACEMSLLEHTSGFATFANMGKHNQTTGVDRIVDGNDKLIFQNSPQNQEVVNPQAAYELVSIMTDNDARSYIFGKKNPLTLPDRLVAAKTGTTQNWKDGFTMGFTPSLAVGVWTGNNDGTLMRAGADGVVTAAPLWHAFLEEALKGTPAENFPEPDGITRLKINPATGKVIKTAKGGKLEVFASYAIPYNDFQLPKRVVKKPDLSTKKPNYNDLIENRQEETVILEPWETETVLKTPFDVKVYTGSSSLETTVELSLDGKVIANLTEAPFLYTVSDKLANGQHTLTAKATHFGLLESTDTVKFKTFFNPPPLAPRGK